MLTTSSRLTQLSPDYALLLETVIHFWHFSECYNFAHMALRMLDTYNVTIYMYPEKKKSKGKKRLGLITWGT